MGILSHFFQWAGKIREGFLLEAVQAPMGPILPLLSKDALSPSLQRIKFVEAHDLR